MAHMAKYKAAAVGLMLHHYDRDRSATLARDNVDGTRTHLNYTVGEQRGRDYIDALVAEVEESQGRSVRSDAVRMADWVITLPPDVREGDEGKFFEEAYRFVEQRYGDENCLGGRVHMDETTPHMHVPIVPVIEREDGRLALSAKEMFDRADLRTFHRDLADAEERQLGYRPQVLLSEDRAADKQLSHLGQDEYRQAKDRLERLRQEERAAEERNRELERERGRAEGRVGQLEAQVEEREAQVEAVREEGDKAGKRVEVLGRAVEFAREAVERVREQLEQLEKRVMEARDRVRDRLAERHEMGQERSQRQEWGWERDEPQMPR